MNKKIVVITGASGFIGRYVAKHLETDESFKVVPVARSKCELDNFVQVEDYTKTPEGNYLVHLAEQPDCGKVNSEGDAYIDIASSTLAVILKNKYERVIYASSSLVYGDQGEEPYMESSPVTTNNTYSVNKTKSENTIRSLENGVVLRLANVIGPGMSASNVVSDIISQIPGQGELVLRNGSPIRDFICVNDVAEVINKLLHSDISGIFNIGSGVGTSIVELAQSCLNIAGEESRKVKSMVADSAHSYNVMNIDKISNELGWRVRKPMSECLQKIFLNHKRAE
ncbi:NAD(P)-dependent oxidoreductase [Litoricola sp.]|nr:NAD(P)-dependent oxidoreductase [Litorivicinus sp.]